MRASKNELLMWLNLVQMTAKDEDELHVSYPNAKYISNDGTDTQCYCLLTTGIEKGLIIAFRGTEPKIRDWCTDLNAFHQIYPYGNTDSKIQVHRGVLHSYKSVRDNIHEYINKHRKSIKHIYVIGHSLGGGLATLCAVDMQYNFTDNVTCVTFGAIRVGNKAFCNSYNKRVPDTRRIYLRNDVVPTLPPRWVQKYTKGGYAHVEKGIGMGTRNLFWGLIQLIRRGFTKRLTADLTNHSISLYRQVLLT